MGMNALRRELVLLLSLPGDRRSPALRRCREEDWLYTSDYPTFLQAPEEINQRLQSAGWTISPGLNGWILLRKQIIEPPEDWFAGPFGTEASCCRTLLLYHPERVQEPENQTAFRLIKAGEEGLAAYERACRRLHQDWAVRLRIGRPLPEISLRFFTKEEHQDALPF